MAVAYSLPSTSGPAPPAVQQAPCDHSRSRPTNHDRAQRALSAARAAVSADLACLGCTVVARRARVVGLATVGVARAGGRLGWDGVRARVSSRKHYVGCGWAPPPARARIHARTTGRVFAVATRTRDLLPANGQTYVRPRKKRDAPWCCQSGRLDLARAAKQAETDMDQTDLTAPLHFWAVPVATLPVVVCLARRLKKKKR